MDNMTTHKITMEEARIALMNYNTVAEKYGEKVEKVDAKILSVNDDNTVDWIYFNSKQHSKIKIIYDWVFLESSKVGGIIEEGDGIFISIKNIEKYLK